MLPSLVTTRSEIMPAQRKKDMINGTSRLKKHGPLRGKDLFQGRIEKGLCFRGQRRKETIFPLSRDRRIGQTSLGEMSLGEMSLLACRGRVLLSEATRQRRELRYRGTGNLSLIRVAAGWIVAPRKTRAGCC
jgi:hypothetical protein